MFGNNPVRQQEVDAGTRLWVQEVFYTLQGEGPFSGEPAVFVRMAGCNLKCFFCDADFESSSWRVALEHLVNFIVNASSGLKIIPGTKEQHGLVSTANPPVKRQANLVVITGGEPMRQNIVPLIRRLNQLNYRVQIETNGTLWLPELDCLFFRFDSRAAFDPLKSNTIVCSPKTRGLNPETLPFISAFKYVVKEGEVDDDGLPTRSTQIPGRESRIYRPWPEGQCWDGTRPIYVQPCCEYEGPARFVNLTGSNIPVHYNEKANKRNVEFAAQIALKHGYRLSVQTHKWAGLP